MLLKIGYLQIDPGGYRKGIASPLKQSSMQDKLPDAVGPGPDAPAPGDKGDQGGQRRRPEDHEHGRFRPLHHGCAGAKGRDHGRTLQLAENPDGGAEQGEERQPYDEDEPRAGQAAPGWGRSGGVDGAAHAARKAAAG